MTKLLHGSLQHFALDERLRAAADNSAALADQIDELLELRDAVRTAELATVCKKQSSKKLLNLSPCCRIRERYLAKGFAQ
jgi:hypothetical protein